MNNHWSSWNFWHSLHLAATDHTFQKRTLKIPLGKVFNDEKVLVEYPMFSIVHLLIIGCLFYLKLQSFVPLFLVGKKHRALKFDWWSWNLSSWLILLFYDLELWSVLKTMTKFSFWSFYLQFPRLLQSLEYFEQSNPFWTNPHAMFSQWLQMNSFFKPVLPFHQVECSSFCCGQVWGTL